ncbi:flagellar filament capping protein FliD [Effusibacillus lacus]|uniref:Flagellar hook-associated protein 2 n=1 Tax=Effusibacillus lacus TaxID=1348429 RepID=A0A292YCA2_9BACL|nr:flagellar filament capping protein FliD [Effusibacillus lacus]TCS69820.1 flagellar hook-associated protein 2 [Effusibacillus lacus]GAX88902.1 hypothetical protein EFBL_0516 [Effusibacillus lacus]
MSNGISFTGLSSGLDWNSLVNQLMEIERLPLQRMETQRSNYSSEKSIWQQINTKLSAFDTALADLKLDATFNSKKVISSKEEIVKGTADSTAVNGKYTVEVVSMAKVDRYVSDTTFTTLGSSGNLTINVGAESLSISLAAGDDANAVATKINQAVSNKKISDTTFKGVTATVVGGRLMIEGVNTGAANTLSFTDDQGGVLVGDLGFYDSAANRLQTAADSHIKVNGLDVYSDSNEVKNALSGVTLTLVKQSLGETATIEVKNDVEKTTAAVQKIIDTYNDLINYINDQTKLDKDSKTGGTLKGDTSAKRLMDRLRFDLHNSVAKVGAYTDLSQIGIKSSDKTGVLTLDTSKLTAAIEKNPTDVKVLFFSGDTTKPGVGDKLDKFIDSYVKAESGVFAQKDKNYDSIIKDLDKQIESFEARMELREKNLRAQYLAMETALAQLNSQGNWLAGQLAGLTAQK